MPIEAGRYTQNFLLSDQERNQVGVGQLEVGVTDCDEVDLPLLTLLEPFEIRKINTTDIFRPVRLPIQSPGC